MIDAERGSGEPLLNSIGEVPYSTLRGLLEHFVEQPATTSSGFQNFI
ncbi:hypothetical protein [Herbidospora yilanensis]|nr:hypothetical protein [Herbidospora yilanensis]